MVVEVANSDVLRPTNRFALTVLPTAMYFQEDRLWRAEVRVGARCLLEGERRATTRGAREQHLIVGADGSIKTKTDTTVERKKKTAASEENTILPLVTRTSTRYMLQQKYFIAGHTSEQARNTALVSAEGRFVIVSG